MNKISLKKLDLDIYTDVLDNGLRVYLCKIPRNTIHGRITSLFGGSILEFKVDGEFCKMPAGVAHFLEHKLFEKKDYDPTTVYEKNGAMGNAFTNAFITSYYFNGCDNFYDNLENLLKLVCNPYFTDKNVLKEKGIISQEKKADMDDPYSIVYDRSLINTFKNSDYKNTVLGSLEDIESITKEDLYKCFNTFYHPSNMLLTISGDIDIEKTMNFIKSFYSNIDFGDKKDIIIKDKKEDESVVKEKEYIYKDIKYKEIQVNYKVKNIHMFDDNYLNGLYLSLMLDMNFGGLSDISDIAQRNSNFVSGISSRMTMVDDYFLINFNVCVKNDENEAIEIIDNTLKNFNYDVDDFNLLKKTILNGLILSTEDTDEICYKIVNHTRQFGKIIDNEYDLISSVDFDILKKYSSLVNLENRSIVILEKKAD